MSFFLPGKRFHDRNSPDYVPSVLSFSKSHPKKRKARADKKMKIHLVIAKVFMILESYCWEVL